MLSHIIKLSFRGYMRHKSTFLINLLGLSTGLACVLLIYLWVMDESSVDKFSTYDEHLYQVRQNYALPNGIQAWEYTPGLLAESLLSEMPEIELASTTSNRFYHPKGILSANENTLEVKGILGDQQFFKVFSYPLLQGEVEEVLRGKGDIALSESSATKLFGNPAEAMGKNLRWKNGFFDTTLVVSGVYADPPANASRQFDVIASYDILADYEYYAKHWNGDYAETFLVLKPDTDIAAFNEKIGPYLRIRGANREPSTLFLQAYSEQYLHGTYEAGVQVGGRIVYVRLFSLIALFILLIACINFMNLSTAKASIKTKEIGVKKTIGAKRSTLIAQFLGESLIMASLSFMLAIVLVVFLLPQFNSITGKNLNLVFNANMVFSIVGIALLTGLIAGSYPAFYLSGFQPIKIFKGHNVSSASGHWIRKSLVVFQFALSIIFIIGVMIVHQQMEYTQNRNLGYERENVLKFTRPSHEDNPQLLLSEIKRITGVLNAGNMYSTLMDRFDNSSGYTWSGIEEENDILFDAPRIGYNVIETMGMEVVQGRSFSETMKDDYTKVLINEAALKLMDLDEPIGKKLGRAGQEKEIIGVIKDFQYGSLHHKIEPLILRFRPGGEDVLVSIKAGTENSVIPEIEKLFKEFHPSYSFLFSFLDEDYQQLYESELRVATLSKYFSGLAILISCLGLFGLITFTAERRAKEISVRKILGASILNIINLLSKDFLRLVLLAFILATPIAWYAVRQWLQNFAYHINITWWIFPLAGFLAILIALFTVSFQSIKAALANPVESLRSE